MAKGGRRNAAVYTVNSFSSRIGNRRTRTPVA
jgi:hypothetical protein